MGDLVDVGKIGDLKEGQTKGIIIQGKNILLVRTGDRYTATDCRCTHKGRLLASGALQGPVITCPWHGSQFDTDDGHVVRWVRRTGLKLKLSKALRLAKRLQTYEVIINDKRILIQL